MVFDREISFEQDGAAVIWARAFDGGRIKVRVTRHYAESTWRIRWGEDEVRRLMWFHIDDLRSVALREHAAGRREVTL